MTRVGGGVYRLVAGTTAVQLITQAPPVNALYLTGDVLVAAVVWQQAESPDLDPIVSFSTDSGATWHSIPGPGRLIRPGGGWPGHPPSAAEPPANGVRGTAIGSTTTLCLPTY